MTTFTLDKELAIPPYSTVCTTCRHLWADGAGRKCTAFPEGIPLVIWNGLNTHRSPFRGDGGIQYERRASDEEPLPSAAERATDLFAIIDELENTTP